MVIIDKNNNKNMPEGSSEHFFIEQESLSPEEYLEEVEGCKFYPTLLEQNNEASERIKKYKKTDLSFVESDSLRNEIDEISKDLIKYLESPIFRKEFEIDENETASDKYHRWKDEVMVKNKEARKMIDNNKWRGNTTYFARGSIQVITMHPDFSELKGSENIKKILEERIPIEMTKNFLHKNEVDKLKIISEMEESVLDVLDIIYGNKEDENL